MRQLGVAQIDVIEKNFALTVPKNLQFRAAHFKLELYKFLGSGCFGVHVGVVDIDCVMTGPINFPSLPPGTVLAYDITDQIIGEYGRDSSAIRFGARKWNIFIRVPMVWRRVPIWTCRKLSETCSFRIPALAKLHRAHW